MTGEAFPILLDLVDRGVIRILDLVFVRKESDGTVSAIQVADLDGDGHLDLAVFAGASSGLLDEDDLQDAGEVLESGSSAGILVYENVWAAPFATALRRGGARLVASGRIPVQALLAQPGGRAARTAAPARLTDLLEARSIRGKDTHMPGLLRGVARTAVIAGTATSVSNRVSRRQAGRWAAEEQQQAPPPQQQAPPGAAPASPSTGDMLAELKQLAELKDAGVLTADEFATQKARILGT